MRGAQKERAHGRRHGGDDAGSAHAGQSWPASRSVANSAAAASSRNRNLSVALPFRNQPACKPARPSYVPALPIRAGSSWSPRARGLRASLRAPRPPRARQVAHPHLALLTGHRSLARYPLCALCSSRLGMGGFDYWLVCVPLSLSLPALAAAAPAEPSLTPRRRRCCSHARWTIPPSVALWLVFRKLRTWRDVYKTLFLITVRLELPPRRDGQG